MAISVTPNNPLTLTQPQQTFSEDVNIEGGKIIAQNIQVNVTFTKLVKVS